MNRLPVTESELHAYVDGALPAERAAEVEAYLVEHPEDAARVAAYREQIAALHREFDPVIAEPLPRRLEAPRPWWTRLLSRYAAVAAWIALGGVAGWQLHDYSMSGRSESAAWARRAAMRRI